MHIISKKALSEFWQIHNQSVAALDNWYRRAKKATWQNLVEVQADFPTADLVGIYIIFNIGGNNYRLVVKIEFEKQIIFIKYVLTHKEYSKIF